MDEPEIDYIETDTTCQICYAEFLDSEDLAVHTKLMHPRGIVRCQFCKDILVDVEEYAFHIRDKHLIDIKLCQYCTRAFTDENSFRSHERQHTRINDTKYSCSQCEMRFDDNVGLKFHEYNTHKNDTMTNGIWLKECMPHLSSILNMNLIQIFQDYGKLLCTVCKACSPSLEDYIEHLKRDNCRSLACNVCCNSYKTKRGLWKHFHNNSECRTYNKLIMKKCLECLKDFPIKLWKAHHRQCKVIKCETCQIIFEKLDELSKHQLEKHPLAVSIHVCKYCHKEFVGTVTLNKHIERTHDTNLYKYKCVYCENVFKHPQKLFAHFYSRHKEIEPYYCSLCDKKFRIRKRFTIHIKLIHKSVGTVEFDDKFHVSFNKIKSENERTNHQAKKKTTEIDEASEDPPDQVFVEIDGKPINSDFMATETEAQTEDETKVLRPRKKVKLARMNPKPEKNIDSDSSDDQPLLVLRTKLKTVKTKKGRPSKLEMIRKQLGKFVCRHCGEFCKTYRNYHFHMKTAHPNVNVKCVKCSTVFGSRMKLSAHIANKHSSSKLTETLKNILEKRKNNNNIASKISVDNTLTNTEKFMKTIKKVECDSAQEPAKLTPLSTGLSVQKFIENFTPESNEPKKNVLIDSNISIIKVNRQPKSSFIKLTKFQPKPVLNIYRNKLTMPKQFKPDFSIPCNVTVNVVNAVSRPLFTEQHQNNGFNDNSYEPYEEIIVDDKNDVIPEVAQEVMLEGSVEKQKIHKVIIPKIPKGMGQIRIATLQPEAPFYKILKVDDVLAPKENKEEEKEIKLPNGKKLVSVNPLAHLMGNIPIDKIMENVKTTKYYQPKTVDFEKAVAKALMNEKKTPSSRTKNKKSKKKIAKVEQ